jgi:hypothetical protein
MNKNKCLVYKPVYGFECLSLEENCNYENCIFAGFESLTYGVLEDHVLLITHELKFCVCVSDSLKKKVHQKFFSTCKQLKTLYGFNMYKIGT